ncbi:MAG: hypothetical protein IJU70_03020 [Lentisphaeria bacterium]|nr:hypothetical protein [Lentisphaeria bacterium]
MGLKSAAAILAALTAFCSGAAEHKVVFSDDFRTSSALSARWRNFSAPGKSSYAPGADGLTVTVRNNPFRDGYIECDVPLIKRGMLEFDMEFPDPSYTQGIGLFVELYNITTFFHGSCGDWRAYFPEPESKRIEGFNIEPVGHKRITRVSPKGRSHYRIFFDQGKDRVEFFRNDMEDPAFIQGGVSVFGHDFYRGGKLRIGSMGWAAKPYQYRISNLRLTELRDGETDSRPRNRILLFQGMTFDELLIFEALTANGVSPKNCIRYTLSPTGASTIIINRLKYDRLPGESRLKSAKTIILADAPAGPDGIIPDFVLEDMADSVRSGGRLVIFGGFFTLEKGEYQKTPLAGILPVELGSPFTTGKFFKPVPLKSNAPEYGWINSCKSFGVMYYHDLKLKKGAVVKLAADGKPMLVEWPCGKGSVAVFLGKKAGRGELFTDNPQWYKLASQICKGK